MTLAVRRWGGPTVSFTYGGLVFMTDPTFDPPGTYEIGSGTLTKTAGPRGTPEDAGPVDVVLLSHDQHPDNLDTAGRAFALTVPLLLSTPMAAQRLGPPATPLDTWEHVDVGRRDGGEAVRVTAVPALHGPADIAPAHTGPVTGFVLEGEGLPRVYVSGDNASLAEVSRIAARFAPVDVAIIFGGAARVPMRGDVDLTLGAAGMVEAARMLGAPTVIPAHIDSWAHFTEGLAEVRHAFQEAGLALSDE